MELYIQDENKDIWDRNIWNISVSVSVHLFPKKYKYIIYTKLNNEEETSIKAQGRWHGGHQY